MGFGLFVEFINIRINRKVDSEDNERVYKTKEDSGLETQSGVKLFEGDVIKLDKDLIGKIVYEPEMAGFLIEFDNFKTRHQNRFRLNYDVVYYAEKLGSIYDKPELKDELTEYSSELKPDTFEFH